MCKQGETNPTKEVHTTGIRNNQSGTTKINKKQQEKPKRYIDINLMHRIYGHASEAALRETAKQYNWKVTGHFEACKFCGMSNVTKADVSKTTESRSKIPGERIFIDTTSVTDHKSLGGGQYWLAVMDDATSMKWSHILKEKSEVPDRIMQFARKMADRGTPIKYIRLDDAGENKRLAELCAESKEASLRQIDFEFTARDNPQHNGRVERWIAVGTAHIRATYNAAGLEQDQRQGLWGEVIMFLTDVQNVLQSRVDQQPAYRAFFKKDIPHADKLRQFGEIGYVKFGPAVKGKLKDRGVPMLYLGRAKNHSGDTYRLLNLQTNKVVLSRDATWINKTYGQWKGLNLPPGPDMISVLSREQLGTKLIVQPQAEQQPVTVSDEDTTTDSDPTDGKVLRQLRELAKLESSFNPEATTLAERLRASSSHGGGEIDTPQVSEVNPMIESAAPAFTMVDRFGGDINLYTELAERGFAAIDEAEDPEKLDPTKYKYMFDAPNTFDEAWNHPDEFQQKKWREAIRKELDKMERMKVWRKIKRSEMEPGRRCVKHKWVHEIKRTGRFRSRLVACGYSQIPGVDFEHVYSPVANDISFRIVLIYLLKHKELSSLIFDVETAFLHGDMDITIYMDCPEGVEHEPDECVVLDQSIYGLVQASRIYNRKITRILKRLGFTQCLSDPCLFFRRRGQKICIVLIYVDDNLVVGHPEEMEDLLKGVRDSGFVITVDNELTDYLSCEIRMNSRRNAAWIGQPHMIKKIHQNFAEEVKKLPKYRTPGTPGFGIVKTENESEMIAEDKQSRYRTGVGMLMYLIKHSRPDIANAVRELAKCLGKATKAAYKELLRCIKYVLETKDKGLLMAPTQKEEEWLLEIFSDSDWAEDKNDRRSITSLMIFLEKALIIWRSKSQKVVALSSSEAEFYACGEAVREVPFIAQILLFLGVRLKIPVPVRIDNVGAIFMSENKTSSNRTRHMDTRWHFVNQMQEDGLVKIIFVKSEENISDIGTKNVTGEVLERHEGKLIVERDKI